MIDTVTIQCVWKKETQSIFYITLTSLHASL